MSKGTNRRPEGVVFTNRPSGPITWFRVVGTTVEFELRRFAGSFTIGRRPTPGDLLRADIQLDHALVSLVHAELERRGDRLWYRDKGSTNGTMVQNERVTDDFVVTRGMIVRVAEPELIALDDHLVELRRQLAWCMGLDAHAAIDRTIHRVVDDGPVLLVGPRGCDQGWLAAAIHRSSGRRDYPYVAFTDRLPKDAMDRLDEARWGTVFVDLATAGKVTQQFARKLLGADNPELRLRPIIAAPNLDECAKVLGQLALTHAITLPPLSLRSSETPRLIDRLLEERGVRWRTTMLSPHRVAALAAHPWPENMPQLREAARRIGALLEHGGNLTRAAEALSARGTKLSRQALGKYFRLLFGE